MSVYVDQLFPCPVSPPKWYWSESCHLYADTLEELHAFAQRIGMKREWFQDKLDFPHYDLNASRRRRAVFVGAVEVSRQQMVAYHRAMRAKRLEREVADEG